MIGCGAAERPTGWTIPEESPLAQHPNIALAREAWSAVSQGDGPRIREMWSPGVVWHATARGTPWSGDHVGPDAILDFLARIGESVDRFDVHLEDVLASDSRFAYIMEIDAERSGRSLKVVYQLTATVEDGRIVEVWTAPLDPAALRAFWD